MDAGALIVWLFLFCSGVFLAFLGLMILVAWFVRLGQLTLRVASRLSGRSSSA